MKSVQIKPHRKIQPIAFERVCTIFGAIENVLHLHYASHTKDPLLLSVLQQATKLCQIRVDLARLETILGFDSELYVFGNVSSASAATIGLPTKQFSERKILFTTKINQWIDTHPDALKLPTRAPTSSFSSSSSSSSVGVRVSGFKSNKIIKPTSTKFKLTSPTKSSSSSTVLERIKEKERLSKLAVKDPEPTETDTIESKLIPIYNILYQLGSSTNHLMIKLVNTINDSFKFKSDTTVIQNSIVELSNRLPSINVVKYHETLMVSINKLQRDHDLQLIGKKV